MSAAQATTPAAIDSTLGELTQAAMAGDPDRIAACFTDDAEVVNDGPETDPLAEF